MSFTDAQLSQNRPTSVRGIDQPPRLVEERQRFWRKSYHYG